MLETLTAPAIPDLPIYRLTVDQYEAMIKAGILNEDDRTELLEGWLVPKMTKNPPHIGASIRVNRLLHRILPDEFCLASEAPVKASKISLPEPDVIILRGDGSEFGKRRPLPADVVMVIEISDSSLEKDTTTKPAIYGRAGVPIYWVLVVRSGEERLLVYTEPYAEGPQDAGFRRIQHFRPDDTIPLILDGQTIAEIPVGDLLP